VKADYSQIELSIAAHLAGEEKMLDTYWQPGGDLRRLTASLLLGKGKEEVSKADRQLAEAVNFGLLYGMGAAARTKRLSGWLDPLGPVARCERLPLLPALVYHVIARRSSRSGASSLFVQPEREKFRTAHRNPLGCVRNYRWFHLVTVGRSLSSAPAIGAEV